MGLFSHLEIYYFPQVSVSDAHTFHPHHFNNLIEEALHMIALGVTELYFFPMIHYSYTL